MIDEIECFLLAALNVECEDGASAVGEVLLEYFVIGVICKSRVEDLLNLRMVCKVFKNLIGILDVTLYAERKCLCALEEQECCER